MKLLIITLLSLLFALTLAAPQPRLIQTNAPEEDKDNLPSEKALVDSERLDKPLEKLPQVPDQEKLSQVPDQKKLSDVPDQEKQIPNQEKLISDQEKPIPDQEKPVPEKSLEGQERIDRETPIESQARLIPGQKPLNGKQGNQDDEVKIVEIQVIPDPQQDSNTGIRNKRYGYGGYGGFGGGFYPSYGYGFGGPYMGGGYGGGYGYGGYGYGGYGYHRHHHRPRKIIIIQETINNYGGGYPYYG